MLEYFKHRFVNTAFFRRIVRGLAKINRKDLVDAFNKAFKEDLPFPENLNV